MSYKLKLNQVREILGMAVKLESAKLEDGTVINFEELEAGYPVFAEDGTTPLAAGEYKLEDGTVLKVDENGLMAEVTPPVETPAELAPAEVPPMAADPEPAEPKKEDTPAMSPEDMKTMNDKIDSCFVAIEAVAKEVADLKTKLEKFSASPAAPKIPKVSAPEPVKIDRVESAIEFIKSAKK